MTDARTKGGRAIASLSLQMVTGPRKGRGTNVTRQESSRQGRLSTTDETPASG